MRAWHPAFCLKQGTSTGAGGFRADSRRRGSVYIAILGAATLVTVIGISALLVARVQHRQVRDSTDFAKARLYALSAVDLGLLLIQQNPDTWREDFDAGNLPTDQPIGDGTLSLEAIDPTDGDIDDSDADPVRLTGIGCAGNARFKLQVLLKANGEPTAGSWRQVVD